MKSNSLPSFKQYAKRYPEILFESPYRSGFSYDEPLVDNELLNIENTQQTVLAFPIEGTFPLSDHELTCHRESYETNKFQDYWVSPKDMTCIYFVFEELSEHLRAGGVWQHRKYRGVAREILFGFYLPRVKFIESDSADSDQGEQYWKRIIAKAIREGYFVSVFDQSTNQEQFLNATEDPFKDLSWDEHYSSPTKVFRLYSKQNDAKV